MKKNFLFLILVMILFIFNGCGLNLNENESNSATNTYEDDFIKFNYNSDAIENLSYNPTDDILYFHVSKLINDTMDTTSLSNSTSVNIWVSNTNLDTYQMYKNNPKTMFTGFFNMLLDTDEISVSDVQGTQSTTLECDKILSNGNHIKAKILLIDENVTAVITCNILPNIKSNDSQELINVYNSIVYKNPKIADKLYTDNYISMEYNPDILIADKFTETDTSYIMIVRKNSNDFDTSYLFANSIIEITTLPVTSDFGNMYINNPDLCATLFNGVLSTDEITALDISDGSCNKELSDGRIVKVKFLNDVNNNNIIAIYSTIKNEDAEIIEELKKTYESINN